MAALDAVVVGGGLSGLATAFHLQAAGLSVEVLEADARTGGTIGSRRHEGFLYETGPNSALDSTPQIAELIEALGLRDQRIETRDIAKRRYVVRDGRLQPLPSSPPAFVASPLFSWRAKARLLREPFIARSAAGEEETIADFVRRRLGSELLDYAIDPFVSGVYAGDPEAIAVRAAFPRLHALEQRHGSLIRGQLRGARERRQASEKGKHAAQSFSFRDGMQTLTDALAARVSPGISTTVHGVSRAGDRWRVEGDRGGIRHVWDTQQVVLSVPAYAAAPLVRTVAADAAEALLAIDYAPVAVIVSGYRREQIAHALDGFGVLVPKVERRRILGTLFSSSTFEGRAPPDRVLLTTFVGGKRQPELIRETDATLATLVADELRALLGASGEPQWSQVVRWARAIPQYTVGHLARIATVDTAELENPGLHFCANYRRGVSVGDCIKSARETADRVIARMQASPVRRATA